MTAYAVKTRIVDGNDGRIYIIELRQRFISVVEGHFKWWREKITPADTRYDAVRALFTPPLSLLGYAAG